MIAILNFMFTANTRSKVSKAVKSARFQASKSQIIVDCASALADTVALRNRVHSSAWPEVAPICQDIRRAVVEVRTAGGSIGLEDYQDNWLRDIINDLSWIETCADVRTPTELEIGTMLTKIISIREFVTKVESAARARFE